MFVGARGGMQAWVRGAERERERETGLHTYLQSGEAAAGPLIRVAPSWGCWFNNECLSMYVYVRGRTEENGSSAAAAAAAIHIRTHIQTHTHRPRSANTPSLTHILPKYRLLCQFTYLPVAIFVHCFENFTLFEYANAAIKTHHSLFAHSRKTHLQF